MKKTITFLTLFTAIFAVVSTTVSAQPYGTGDYGIVTYGNETSLSISTDGNVGISVTPTVDGALSTGSSNVTVSSTDVEGYKLYIRALTDTDMDNLGTPLPASANGVPASLANNTWGYNTDASTDYVGISLTDALIRSTIIPVTNQVTTVTYGVKLDMAKPAGIYTADVIYTAVPQTD